MAEIKGKMNLLVQKIQMKENEDWRAAELDNLEPGLYLCESPDGGMFLMSKMIDGARLGLWLPIVDIGKLHAQEAEQKVFERIKTILEKGFGDIESRLKSIENTTNNSDFLLAELDENKNTQIAMIEERLDTIRNLIAELPKHSEQQKSTFAEMSDAVVNIIKAAK